MKRNRTQWRDDLSRTSWQDFERLLARHYREDGFDVEHCGTGRTAGRFDGGVDLVLRRDGETTLVQCKHWNAAQVPHNDVHQLLGLVETRQAQRAVLITSGEFTAAARDAASKTRRIELIDGTALRLMIDPRMIPAPSARPGTDSDESLVTWAPVVEKALDAFMDVRTGGRWRRRRQTPDEALKELGLKLLVAVVLAVIGFVFIRSQVRELQANFAPPATTRAVASPGPQPAARSVQPVDAPRPALSPTMTPEQLREWERKNAEAMEVLERTTPSVYD